MYLAELKKKNVQELSDTAEQLGVEGAATLRRQELVFAILKAQGSKGEISADGVIEVLPDGFGFLRAPDCNYLPGADDIYVSPSQIRRFNLRTGDTISGWIRPPKEAERYFALLRVESVNGDAPEGRRTKTLFDNLTPVYPTRRFALEHDRDALATRVLDLLCPIGFGQRGLVIAPPRAGKTALLRDLARAIERNHPDTQVLVLLIDERPEEVTEMRRAVAGEVVSSTFDEPPARHVQVAEIVLEKAKRLAESKRDVVILLDSLTKLTRAYNTVVPPSGKLLAGGLDANALAKPKRFFGAARALEEGGSLTIIATAMTETGSRMDEVILEEIRGTGNCELHLDRGLCERRLFPCLDIKQSATRRDELLITEAQAPAIEALRRQLQPLDAVEAIELLRAKLAASATNADLLAQLR